MYKYLEVSLKRCCHLSPFKTMSFDEFSKIDDVVEYATNFNYESPETYRRQMTMDRCKVCSFPPDKIKQVVVSISHACNLNCYHCLTACYILPAYCYYYLRKEYRLP